MWSASFLRANSCACAQPNNYTNFYPQPKRVDSNITKQRLTDARYLRMAFIWAENSYCKRRKVGALLVKDNAIISDGYNGTPSGFPNICETSDNVTFPYVLHAEANAITKVARSSNSSDGSTLYVTTSPCMECSKLIIQSGIRRVVFSEKYRITDGLDLLGQAGIEVVHFPVQEAIEVSREEIADAYDSVKGN